MNENNIGNILLGVIAAVALYLLWKYHRSEMQSSNGAGSSAGSGSSCSGDCGCGTGACAGAASPSYVASPTVQTAMIDSFGLAGSVSPGTPPLGGSEVSFYGATGPTTDQSFTFTPAGSTANTPGSATTPAATIPVRATAPVATYAQTGFVSKYNVSGVPLSIRRAYLQ
jgi:hypothetical protein